MFRLKPHSNTSLCSSSFLQANMFSKLPVVAVSLLITLAAAIPNTTPPVTTPTSNQCCASVVPSTSSALSVVTGLLGLDLSGLNVPIGLSCSPITVGGNNCGGTTVVCDAPEKEWGGLIAINCLPITL
ncbi:Hydrophobin 2 [Mycena sanguinolenta]|uniref:Hydrophobin n=1 Tax=Mycena sanguinolenta TaxID=230812 RepID=A0A8H6YJG1_9AGAR|nr:Hydrophobin 2 [Mycena sanguinolenta]